MLSPPMPWISPKIGGQLIRSTDFMRQQGLVADQLKKINDLPLQNLYPIIDSLNCLSLVPWSVNQKVLKVAMSVFSKGGDTSLDIPLSEDMMPSPPSLSSDMSSSEKAKLNREKMRLLKDKAEMYSLWCNCLYVLSIANHVRTVYTCMTIYLVMELR